MLKERQWSLATRLIHSGEPAPRIAGAVVMPIFQSSIYEYAGGGAYDDIPYLRLSNTPTHTALHAKLANLESAQSALVTASGMGAIAATLLTLLSAGGHLLAQLGLYGGTHSFISKDLEDFGMSADFIDASRPDTWKALLRPTTRAIYVETITNPLCRVENLLEVVGFARAHGLLTIIDNTLATPINFRPIEHGFDICLHSATKYLNGHSDIVAGVVIGRKDLVDRIRHRSNSLGPACDPHTCFLLQRGIKTLALRVERQNANAVAIAKFLSNHPAVSAVHYPGLSDHPDHGRARTLLDGFGGLLSFELRRNTRDFMARLRLPCNAPSSGGVESLITRPAITSHASLTPDARRALGIGDNLVRMSVGIEDVKDLICDLEAALDTVDPARAPA